MFDKEEDTGRKLFQSPQWPLCGSTDQGASQGLLQHGIRPNSLWLANQVVVLLRPLSPLRTTTAPSAMGPVSTGGHDIEQVT